MVFPIHRRSGEDVWDWRVRHSETIFEIYCAHRIVPWNQQWLSRYFTWSGHLARRGHLGTRLAEYRSLHWKSVVAAITPPSKRAWTGHSRPG
eukprot:2739726-Alexandrium_andersonii.AAC.1